MSNRQLSLVGYTVLLILMLLTAAFGTLALLVQPVLPALLFAGLFLLGLRLFYATVEGARREMREQRGRR